MLSLNELRTKAQKSNFWMWFMNFFLYRFIPFNKPHGFRIITIDDYATEVLIPYKKVNFNHIKGIHACAMATAAEYCTGFTLLNALDAKKYRLILQHLEMQYHYQGKTDLIASFTTTQSFLDEQVINPLKTEEKILVTSTCELYDKNKNHVATGKTTWQIKSWDKVKTKQ
ncbi:MAG: DUF4442 domain-containing protein [Luteibaculaceae bacterium]